MLLCAQHDIRRSECDPYFGNTTLGFGDQIDLHRGVARQTRDLNGGAGRRVFTKKPGINLVHAPEFPQIPKVHGGLQNFSKVRAARFQNRGQVLEYAFGLGGDVTGDELAGGGVQGNLSGDENQISAADGLGIRANGGRCLWSGNLLFTHVSPPVNPESFQHI